jgi:fatty-acyl-CoA synthase
LRFQGATTTWQQLHRRVTAVAQGYERAGVRRGDRVAIFMTNRPECIEATLAANAVGAIAVPLNFRLSEPEAAGLVTDCGARLLVTDASLLGPATRMSEGADIALLVTGVDAAAARAGNAHRYEEWIAAGTWESTPHLMHERDVALIMYTSGTTGRPKGAMLTHLNLMMQAIAMIRTHRLVRSDDVYFLNVPLFHVAGIGTMPAPLLNATPTVIMPTGAFDAEATLAAIESERVTTMFMVPAQWQALCEHSDAGERTRSLRTISWGGAPATRSLLERMREVFSLAEVISVFGQTETSPPTASLPGEAAIEKLGSVGLPVPTVATRIVDDQLQDVPPGEVGEIIYRGPVITPGYWQNPGATEDAFSEGWFHSGDLVRRDAEGYLYVLDRKKDIVISGGENIYCPEVESALAGHPSVADIAVVGGPHARWGETPVAFVVAASGEPAPELADLHAWSAGTLASYKRPTRLILVDELPRNASGKILKHVLRDRLRPGGSGAPPES